jgi:UDP-N-acetyl-D-glucosamine 4,6-dehydratase
LKDFLKPTQTKRTIFFISSDILISFFSLFLAYNLRFNFVVPADFMNNFLLIFMILLVFKISFFSYFNIYKTAWRFFSLYEIKKILLAHLYAYLSFVAIFLIFREEMSPFARSIIIIDFMLSLVFIVFFRLLKRILLETGSSQKYKNTLIIGADPYIRSLLQAKKDLNYSPVAMLDDKPELINTYISNLKVYAFDDLKRVIKSRDIEAVIISKTYEQKSLIEIFETLNKLEITDIKVINNLQDNKELKDISVEDLLARHPKDLDKELISNFIKDKIVLITGAGGSIGSEISRQCAKFGAKRLILLDHSEFNLYTIAEELNSVKPVLVMQSVINRDFLDLTFDKYKPQIVIHAAAYKHVPLVEDNIPEAILNNIIGTKNSIDCAIKHNVEKFVLISTDKAVRPTNVMGTTKRICELYAQNVEPKNTEIVAVRFGNVLGSSGSVIPKFKMQISQDGPITVTHPDITRYFMLIPEACELVLQAASIGKGGEIFILDMGEPIKIVDLAKKMIELSGKENIKIEFTGLRPGEKLYEELLISDSDMKTQYESITVASKTYFDIDVLNKKINELVDDKDKVLKLKEIVPEFDHKINN